MREDFRPPSAGRDLRSDPWAAPFHPYPGKVRLLVSFPPWQLLISLRGLNVSELGVWALLANTSHETAEVADLLVEEDSYELQLEHEADSLAAPFVRAKLAGKRETNAGWELGFIFAAPDPELLGLIAELGHGTPHN